MITEADTCRKYVLPKLYSSGWEDDQINEQKFFTDGRIVVFGEKHFRKPGKKADYILKYKQNLPIAVIEAKAAYKSPADGMQQAIEYAKMLGLKFAYSTNGKGIEEFDFTTGKQRSLDNFPLPTELWNRYCKDEGLIEQKDTEDIAFPCNRDLRNNDGSIKTPRYFQDIAINEAVKAFIKGKKRILLTMATGTGKTFVAFQIIWKLWKRKRAKKILFLADRNVLVDQAKDKTFTPFGDATWKIQQKPNKSREVYFALYQALSGDTIREDLYKQYPRGFFDLVVVDECHRGSAKDESSWRRILEYFNTATQIGLTATPKRKDSVDTYKYFGNPIYTYKLKQGIEDGFLAPYRVHRVVPNIDATGWRPKKGEMDKYGKEIPDGLYGTKEYERVISVLARTEAVAKHLTNFLKKTGRFNKTIVFCVDQEHAEDMRKALINENSDIVKNHSNYCVRVVSLEGEIGRSHLDNFQDTEKDFPIIVTTSQMLTTGIDAPTVKNIVIFKLIDSMVTFKQIIGRGTRLFPDKDKLWFTILDYTGATRLFADSEFDGDPELLSEEEINADGEVTSYEVKEEQPFVKEEIAIYNTKPKLSDDSEGRIRKYYVDNVIVKISAESVQELDSEGKVLRTVEYTDYTKEQVRKLYPNTKELKDIWKNPEKRYKLVEQLKERGISFEQLLEIKKEFSDADPFDLLIHIAYNAPLRTRRERAELVKKEEKGFFDKFTPEARKVLDFLLEKYTDYGYKELDDIHILEVPPMNKLGTPIEIASFFGGPNQMLTAIHDLQSYIYGV